MAQKQRKKKAKEQGSRTSPVYYILGAVAVLGIGIVGYTVGSRAFGSAVTEPVELEVESDRELVELAQGVVAGDPDAPVTVVEFGDYQCPGCGAFAAQVKPLLDANLIETGRASFVFYDFPLVQGHPNAFLAARAARCAGDQDAYWEYHDALFRNQQEWSPSGNPAGRFVDYAEELGLDEDAFESCVRSDRHAETVTANMQLGQALGVSGTPTVMVSRGQGMARRLNSWGYEDIEGAVEEALEEGGRSGAAPGPRDQGDRPEESS